MASKDRVIATLRWLEDQGWHESAWCLEKESGISAFRGPEELMFLRELVMSGALRDAIEFIRPLNLPHAMAPLHRQAFLETVDGGLSSTEELVEGLELLEPLVSSGEYETLCHLLTLASITDHSAFVGWTVHKGRVNAFDTLTPILSEFAKNHKDYRSATEKNEVTPREIVVPAAPLPTPAPPSVVTTRAHEVATSFEALAPPMPPIPVQASEALDTQVLPSEALASKELVSAASPPVTLPPQEPCVANDVNTQAQESEQLPSRLPHFVPAATILNPGCPVRCASFRPDGRFVAVGTNDRALTICGLDFTDRDASPTPAVVPVLRLPGYHQGSVYSAEWSPDGTLLATAGNDKRVQVASFHFDDTDRTSLGVNAELVPCSTFDGHNGTVRDLAFLDASRLVSAGAGDCALRVWDIAEGRADQLVMLEGHSDAVWSVNCPRGSERALTAAADGCVKYWDLRDAPRPVITFVGPCAACCAAEWPGSSSNQHQVAASFGDGLVALFDSRRPNQILCELYCHQQEARSLEFCASSPLRPDLCVTAAFDGTAAVHALASDEDGVFFTSSASVVHQSNRVVRARWHPHELAFLSCSDNGVALWVGE
jgi:WD40 repeat protein